MAKNKTVEIDLEIDDDNEESTDEVIDFSNMTEKIEGDFLATIAHAKSGTSLKGNAKIDLRWNIAEGKHRGAIIYDNITFTRSAMWKVENLFKALGMMDEFNAGKIKPSDLVAEQAMITVAVKASTGINEDTGQPYPDREQVEAYAPAGAEIDL